MDHDVVIVIFKNDQLNGLWRRELPGSLSSPSEGSRCFFISVASHFALPVGGECSACPSPLKDAPRVPPASAVCGVGRAL